MNDIFCTIIKDIDQGYPNDSYSFSPSTQYPEYPFGNHIALEANSVYESVRNILHQTGLDGINYNTPAWNPLGSFINRGDKVFLLCNFVYHKKDNETELEFNAKCTHGSVVRAILDYIHIAVGNDERINFGNAPLQSCNWSQVLIDTKVNAFENFYIEHGIQIKAKDLRLFISERDKYGRIQSEKKDLSQKPIIVSMKENSLLAENKNKKWNRYRVTDYNPESTARYQSGVDHNYAINKEILNSDVIISLPKLKTHEKVGITVGLKGAVGIVGLKDCLAHHQFGSEHMGGDEFPGNSPIQLLASYFHDFVQKKHYPSYLSSTLHVLDLTLKRISRKVFKNVASGAWYGNNTAWRMTLDLVNILHYAQSDGSMNYSRKRVNLVLIDAIIGGEGEGPLSPMPVESNSLIFSNNLALGDLISTKVMKYDFNKIPLINNAIRAFIGLDEKDIMALQIKVNDNHIPISRLNEEYEKSFIPPKGWKGHIEQC